MKNKLIISCLFILKTFSLKDFSIPNARPEKINLKTSLIVPCYHGHFRHLNNLLKMYLNQTVLPDEIVISLSEANLIKPKELENIQKTDWPFKLVLLTTNEQLYAGQNRNKAAEASTGDIIICQDADDVPHNQRIEIIKHIFENFEIEHLMHYFTTNKYEFDHNFEISNIFSSENKKLRITHGNIAISRELFETYKWPDLARGQDILYNFDLFKKGYKKFVATVPLLFYRKNLSSASYVKEIKRSQ